MPTAPFYRPKQQAINLCVNRLGSSTSRQQAQIWKYSASSVCLEVSFNTLGTLQWQDFPITSMRNHVMRHVTRRCNHFVVYGSWTCNISLTSSDIGKASSCCISNMCAVALTPHWRMWGSNNKILKSRFSEAFVRFCIVYSRASTIPCLALNKLSRSSRQLRSETINNITSTCDTSSLLEFLHT